MLDDPNFSGSLDGATRNLVEDLIKGGFSFFLSAFDVALEVVAGFAASTALITALSSGDGGINGGGGDGGGVTPTVKTFLDEVADLFRGSSDADDITARAAIGRIISGGGDDTVRGSNDDDNIKGGGGDDVLRGRGGDDDLLGNGGSDKVISRGADEFSDLSIEQQGNDVLIEVASVDILIKTDNANNFDASDFFLADPGDIRCAPNAGAQRSCSYPTLESFLI